MAQTSDWLPNGKNDAKVFGRQQSIFRKLKYADITKIFPHLLFLQYRYMAKIQNP
jgi:hypothetical protein